MRKSEIIKALEDCPFEVGDRLYYNEKNEFFNAVNIQVKVDRIEINTHQCIVKPIENNVVILVCKVLDIDGNIIRNLKGKPMKPIGEHYRRVRSNFLSKKPIKDDPQLV
jgi:CO dehydrogenase/acetyl-CoA synthase gamma subunit (corrinoid Fe-S protein)